ncbi:SusC/RagA family TonB-linked outer membrane protein [Mucilaginibacter sp. OK268]|uniref:SusC/RagA family TonB-linked outer membrane protein n=1 Tax=Mucilaginibacter sp. OK268 TaxID=1881048 RepID=UPI000B83F460|nr:SusC/RagA family TonB-linked outer membrane protein [Mucilaginibacter sp. OK268]
MLVFTGISFATTSKGQGLLDKRVDYNIQNTSLTNAIQQLEKVTSLKFVYRKNLVENELGLSIDAKHEKLGIVLSKLLTPRGITYDVIGDQIVLAKAIGLAKQPDVVNADEPEDASLVVTKTMAGKVTDDHDQPLPGVTVSIKGTTMGTQTDAAGKYTLNIPDAETEKAILTFSFIGFSSQEIPAGGRSVINVRLVASPSSLNEVIVIGYGSQRKGDVTSSVATVKAENFVKGPVLDAGQLLQGKVAGLSVSAPSGDPTSGSVILLRGNTTLLGANSDPLVLVDGVPGSLKTVVPEDIETIDVLKDGSAAAIYGVRGTNGVIIITTKRASSNFTNAVDYSGYVSTQTLARQPKLFTAADYRAQIAAGTRDKSYDLGSSTDWLKAISNNLPVTTVHTLTLRGGNSKTNYLASVNYRLLNGIFLKSDNRTFSGRVDINHYMFNDKLKINFGLLQQDNAFTQTQDGGTFNGYTYRQAILQNPTAPIKNADGTYFEQPSIFNYQNPVSMIYNSDGRTSNTTSKYNSTITLTPIDGLKLSALGSYTRFNQTAGYSENKENISNIRDHLNGYAAVGSLQSIDRLLELTAEYKKTIGDHNFSVLGGYSYQDNDTFSFFEQNHDFPTDIFSYNNIGLGRAAANGLGVESSTRSETNLISFFGRATYNYKDRYLLLASVRREAASQLYGAKEPWGTFPAVQVGWRITKESFMQGQQIFDDLKLRAGYGVTGNQPAQGFLGVGLLGYGNYVLSNGQWVQTLGPSQNPNPNLRWEEKHETDLGLDYSMLKGMITGSVDLYNRKIEGLLYDYAVPSPPNLYPSTRANVGTMQNKGIEVLLNITPIRNADFQWTTSFNFSTNTNKLISLSNETYKTTSNYFTTGGTGEPIQTFTNIVTVGKNIGDFYGFKVTGVSTDGQWIYEDKDGKSVAYKDFTHSFEDKRVLGNGLPKYYAGWNNNIRYKDWDFSVTMRGAFGYQILNFQRMYYENTSIQYYNRLKSANDKVFGTAVLNKTMPLEFNSYYIENGDFWKIDNINLGYTFNSLKSKYIHAPRIYVSTLNTFVITGYKGIDPEVSRSGLDPGNDNRDKYPTTRTFTLGLSANF